MTLIWQLGWFFRANWQRYVLTVSVLCIIAVIQTKVPALIGSMIDTVIRNTPDTSVWHSFRPQLLTLLAIGVLVYILRYIWRVALYGAAYKLGCLLRQRLFQHYLDMDPLFFQTHRTGELMAHVSNDIQAVEMTAGEGILTLVDSIFMGCLVLTIMITQYSLPLTLISLLPLPIMAYLVARIGREIHHAFGKAQAAFGDVNNMPMKISAGYAHYGCLLQKGMQSSRCNTEQSKQITPICKSRKLMPNLNQLFICVSVARIYSRLQEVAGWYGNTNSLSGS